MALLNGDQAAADALATGVTADSEAGTEVPSVLLVPQAIFPENVEDVIADGFTTAEKVCATDEVAAKCAESAFSNNPHPALAGPHEAVGAGAASAPTVVPPSIFAIPSLPMSVARK